MMNPSVIRRTGLHVLRRWFFGVVFISVVAMVLIIHSTAKNAMWPQHKKESRLRDAARYERISSYFSKQVTVSCDKLIAGDASAIREAIDFDTHRRNVSILPDETYLNLTADCDTFLEARGYSRRPLSEEEAAFPIAFSITFHQNVEEFERLLRLIYQPQNAYCIYIDGKAHPSVLQATQSIVRCLPNVFLAENRTNIVYASYSLLEAVSLNCSRQLLRYDWKYYVNLVSQMFPLRTNREMVQLFKLMAGFNLVIARDPKRDSRNSREEVSFRMPEKPGRPYAALEENRGRKTRVPLGLTYVVGSDYVAVTRAMVEFVFSDDVVRRYLCWLQDTIFPDEAFWSTVNWNILRAPGGYSIALCEGNDTVFSNNCIPELDRYIRWSHLEGRCGSDGLITRYIGILNAHCLSEVVASPAIAANKFYLSYHKSAYECMEEWHTNRTLSGAQLQDSPHFLSIYQAAVRNMQRWNDSANSNTTWRRNHRFS